MVIPEIPNLWPLEEKRAPVVLKNYAIIANFLNFSVKCEKPQVLGFLQSGLQCTIQVVSFFQGILRQSIINVTEKLTGTVSRTNSNYYPEITTDFHEILPLCEYIFKSNLLS